MKRTSVEVWNQKGGGVGAQRPVNWPAAIQAVARIVDENACEKERSGN
jgi:hypothetical protein